MSRNAQLNHASICLAPRRWPCIDESAVYIVELALRMSPVPVSVQRKEADDAEALYQQIRQAIEQSQPRLLELTCEKVEGKKVTVLIGEVLAVQLYEKASATGGSKRPGFSVDS